MDLDPRIERERRAERTAGRGVADCYSDCLDRCRKVAPGEGGGGREGWVSGSGAGGGDDDLESETENGKSDARGPHPGVVCSYTRSLRTFLYLARLEIHTYTTVSSFQTTHIFH